MNAVLDLTIALEAARTVNAETERENLAFLRSRNATIESTNHSAFLRGQCRVCTADAPYHYEGCPHDNRLYGNVN